MALGGITLYRTFALYEQKKEFNILQGKIPDFLSFNVNYVIDGVSSNTKPINAGKYLQTKIECSGVNIYNWDNKKWEVSYDRNSVINKDINCTVEFKTLIILAEVLKLGDYVEMTPTSTSYTIPTTLTAYSSSQTINPSELSLWRVINIKEDETIEMVSEYVSSTDVNFYGAAGYKKLVEGLNTIAAQYANSKYTVATRHMGYDGQTPIITAPLSKSTCGTNNTKDNSKETSGCGDISYETDANLVQSALGTLVVNRVTGASPKNGYWLTARRYNYSNSALYQWNGWRVMPDGSVSSYKLYTYSDGWLSWNAPLAIRPIIILKSGVIASSGLGTRTSPYVLP